MAVDAKNSSELDHRLMRSCNDICVGFRESFDNRVRPPPFAKGEGWGTRKQGWGTHHNDAVLLPTFADEIDRHTGSGGEAIVGVSDTITPAYRGKDLDAHLRR